MGSLMISFMEMIGFAFLMFSVHLGVDKFINVSNDHFNAMFSAMVVYFFVWIIGYKPNYLKHKSFKDTFSSEQM